MQTTRTTRLVRSHFGKAYITEGDRITIHLFERGVMVWGDELQIIRRPDGTDRMVLMDHGCVALILNRVRELDPAAEVMNR